MNSTLKDDLLNGGTNERVYLDGASDNMPYRVREVVFVNTKQSGRAFTCIVVQYEKGAARLPLHEHLYDFRASEDLTQRLKSEGKFKDVDFHPVGM